MIELVSYEDFRAGLDCYSQEDYSRSVEFFLNFARGQVERRRNILSYSFWSLWNNLANGFTKLGFYAKAETCYTSAIKCFQGHKPMVDTGVVFFNYACMLFFYKGEADDMYKAYFLFNLADRVGFKNIYAKKINEQFVKNAKVYEESLSFFYKSRLFRELKEYSQLRNVV